MAAIKTHLLKALEARQKAERAHLAELHRQAEIAAIQRNLDAGAAAAAKMTAALPTPHAPRSTP